MVKEFRISTISTAIVMLVVGCVLLIKPETSLYIICLGLAVAFFALALTRLLQYLRLRSESKAKSVGNLVAMIISVALGVYLILNPDTIARFIPIVLGIIVAIDGVFLVITAFAYIHYLPYRGIITWILGIAAIFLGIFSIKHSFAIQVTLMRFLGASLVAAAVFTIVNHIMIEGAASKRVNATTVDFEAIKNTDTSDNDMP